MPVIEYGGRMIPVKSVTATMRDQNPPAIRQGPPSRSDRQGVRQYKIQSLDKGLGVLRGTEAKDNFRYAYSEGLIAHQQFGLYLPYVSTTVTNTDSMGQNSSGYRAANLRLHSLNSTLGQSNLRYYLGIGPKLLRTTSDSNAVLDDSTLSLTDNITAMFEGRLNDTRYIIVCTDGTTNDVLAISDPTATAPTNTPAFALTSGDWIGGGVYMPTLGPGFNLFYGKIGGVSGIHYLPTDSALLTAPTPVVLTATADEENVDGTAVSYTLYPHNTATTGWTNITNLFADSAAVAPDSTGWATFATDGTAHFVTVIDFRTDYEIPANFSPTGIEIETEFGESSLSSNLVVDSVSIHRSGADVGYAATTNSSEPSATFGSGTSLPVEYGGADDRWGMSLTNSYIRNADFGCTIGFAHADTPAQTAYVDFIRMIFHGTLTGTLATIPLGGQVVGIDPSSQNVLYILAPEFQDQTTAVTVPRVLWRLEFSYDSTAQRPTVAMEKVNTGIVDTHLACFALGGIVVAGDPVSGICKTAKLVRPDGQIVDLAFSSIGNGYTEDLGIVNMWGQGRVLICDVCNSAATMVQSWLYFDQTWHTIGTRETIASLPLQYAGNAQTAYHLSQRYRLYPVSTTSTANTRVFQPRSYFADILHSNTAEIKADGTLIIRLPELDLLGPEEAEKMILTAWNMSRDVSASSTIRLRYSTDSGSNYVTWATFTSFASKSTLSTPVSFRTLILEIGLNHTASSANTPNGLPLLIEGMVRWTPQRQWLVEIDPNMAEFKAAFPGGVEELWDVLSAMDPVETLNVGVDAVPTTWMKYNFLFEPADQPKGLPRLYPAGPRGGNPNLLQFDEVVS